MLTADDARSLSLAHAQHANGVPHVQIVMRLRELPAAAAASLFAPVSFGGGSMTETVIGVLWTPWTDSKEFGLELNLQI